MCAHAKRQLRMLSEMHNELVRIGKPRGMLPDLGVCVILQKYQQISGRPRGKLAAADCDDRLIDPTCRRIDSLVVQLKSTQLRIPAEFDE
jgi:hypothetical protein